MNYYEEILIQIRELIEKEELDEARRLILNELSVPYVPRDFEDELKELLLETKTSDYQPKLISDAQIEEFLYSDPSHQLIAVDELNKKNLRDYIDLCQDYLRSKGFKNAMVLLIDSLIRQEI